MIQWVFRLPGDEPADATREAGTMRNRFRWALVAWAVLGAAALAQAQTPSSYPDRPIRLVIAFPPGGATDTLSRQVTQELGEALGQSVVIENKPGGRLHRLELRRGGGPGRLYATDGGKRARDQPSPLQEDLLVLRSHQAIRRDRGGRDVAAGSGRRQ